MVAVNWGCPFVNDVDWIGDLSSSKHPSTIVTLSSLTYSVELTICE